MSVVAKMLFENEIAERLADKLTLSQLAKVINAVEEQLSFYEVERIEDNQSQQAFDEVLQLFLETKRIEGRSIKTLIR